MEMLEVYETLLGRFGPQGWWPVDPDGRTDPAFEVAVGAILTQQTSWKNVEKAIGNLKRAGAFSPEKILRLEPAKLQEMIRPSGYFRQKADRLRIFCRWLVERYGGDLSRFFRRPLGEAREELLSIKGVGYETADSVLLYGGGKSIFVVDAYSKRMCSRMGISDARDYEMMRKLFEKSLPKEVGIYKEFHALIVELCKVYCRPRPLCRGCPLEARCGKRGMEARPRRETSGRVP